MQIVFTISALNGGGAEHVMMLLLNAFVCQGFSCEVVVTSQRRADADLHGLREDIPCIFLEDTVELPRHNYWWGKCCKVFEMFHIPTPGILVRQAFFEDFGIQVEFLHTFFKSRPKATIISFLHPADQITMAAAEGLANSVVISERADPIRYFKTRYAPYFLNRYYPKLSKMVFQTPQARDYYPEAIQSRGVVIPNPVAKNLPKSFHGERVKKIVNFCRFSPQKNPWLLMDAFDLFAENHPGYLLEFIGEGPWKEDMKRYAATKKHGHRIAILPHRQDIHQSIQKYSMFVSSSDFEGMSNSMLEAMAIGLPTICTDCPIGGAAYIIHDHENGLLVPMKNLGRLAQAMAEVADSPELSRKLSGNGSKIREQLAEEVIVQAWLDVLHEVAGD